MNKTVLIVAGTAVASLAAGGAGGYILAKKQFAETLQAEIDREIEATKRHYGVIITNMQYGSKPDLTDIVSSYPDEDDPALEIEEDLPVSPELEEAAFAARVDYQGFATNTPTEAVTSNIFSDNMPKKSLPPREPGTGKFLPRDKVVAPKAVVNEPYPIEADDFLSNEPEHEQESLLYFINERTLTNVTDINDVIDNDRVGEAYLSNLEAGSENAIYIRHEALEIDYQITGTMSSLTEAMGFGESEKDLPDEADALDENDPVWAA